MSGLGWGWLMRKSETLRDGAAGMELILLRWKCIHFRIILIFKQGRSLQRSKQHVLCKTISFSWTCFRINAVWGLSWMTFCFPLQEAGMSHHRGHFYIIKFVWLIKSANFNIDIPLLLAFIFFNVTAPPFNKTMVCLKLSALIIFKKYVKQIICNL